MLKLEEYYQDVILLAEGGMSKVYLATDKKLGRRVAVKVMSLTQHAQSDALNEARLLARFNHPNIVQIYDVFESDGQMALEMEFVQGATLQHYTKTHVLSTEQKIELLNDIADGLASAHSQNILHLDLKPGNILVNEQGTAKIADFGISQIEDNQATRPHTSYGSLTAMSPEQLREETLDSRSDLFSFGLIAYQLLAGHHPYFEQADDGSDKSIAEQIKFQPLKASAKRILDIPPALAQLIDRLLQYDKNARPSSAGEVSQQLKQILHTLSYDNSEATLSLEEIELQDRAKSKAKARQKQLSIAALFTFLVCLVVGGYWYWQETKPKIYIAALPIEFIGQSDIPNSHKQIVKQTVEDAIYQFLITSKDYEPVSKKEVEQTLTSLGRTAKPSDISHSLQIDKLFIPTGECNNYSCTIQLELIGKSGKVVEFSERITVINTQISATFISISQTLSKALDITDTSEQLMDDNFNNAYSALIEQLHQENTVNISLINQLREFIRTYPKHFSLYTTYTKGSLRLYNRTLEMKIINDLQEVLESSPQEYKETLDYLANRTSLLLLLNKKDDIEKLLSGYKGGNSNSYELLNLKGSIYQKLGRYDQAKAAFNKAYQLKPTLVVLRNLVKIHAISGSFSEALHFADKALSITQKDHQLIKITADISLITGNLNRSIELYETLVKSDSNNANYLTNLSTALSLIKEQDLSLDYATKAYKINEQRADIVLNYADALALANKNADLTYMKVIELLETPNKPIDKLIKAQALAHLGYSIEALKLIQLVKSEAPKLYELPFVSALIMTLIGDESSAIIQIEASLDSGWAVQFFNLKWFDPLCGIVEFQNLLEKHNYSERCRALN
ncbi:protein kinase domain-containing protein [Pseudoalteromonas piscicida]|uniref:Serine/threonine protein kinase n=1 Tax=Pseudoalteromonas piscicida TaxID=43662 RepID=A0A2A5JKQ6_PSEO7|nr:serine/threonine-protein kinase [Pseudoalteromonas piscicida]PCK30013.1 serine/threonine protein kinase [Pseudoalteromonas piscicida]